MNPQHTTNNVHILYDMLHIPSYKYILLFIENEILFNDMLLEIDNFLFN